MRWQQVMANYLRHAARPGRRGAAGRPAPRPHRAGRDPAGGDPRRAWSGEAEVPGAADQGRQAQPAGGRTRPCAIAATADRRRRSRNCSPPSRSRAWRTRPRCCCGWAHPADWRRTLPDAPSRSLTRCIRNLAASRLPPHGITLQSAAPAGRAPGAPVLMFLHGFPEAAFVWDELLEHFARPDTAATAAWRPTCAATSARRRPPTWRPTAPSTWCRTSRR